MALTGALRGGRVAALLFLLALAAPVVGPAVAQEVSEAAVKAAYLVRFLGFVDWPAQSPDAATTSAGAARTMAASDAPLVIGVVAADAVFRELEALIAGRSVSGRPLLARRLRAGEAHDGVHLLHIGRQAPDWSVPAPTPRRPLLVVTDDPKGPPPGSALNFVHINQRVRFEAVPRAADSAGLKLSARLLAVAERVLP